ncbi:MAG: cardiolipin synthase [Christensenellales bacterium]
MSTLQIFLLINYILCLIILFDMIFISKKKFERIAAWTFTLLVPFVGLALYLLIGAGLNNRVKNMLKKKSLMTNEYNAHIKKQIEQIETTKTKGYYDEFKELMLLNLNNCDSILTTNNKCEFYVDGEAFAEKLIDDIRNAKETIHIQFYIFANDKISKLVKQELTKKAQQGVEVRVLYDSIGSFHTYKSSFRKLKKAGGQVAEFFPPFLKIKLLNANANHRNHRKIVVIDGKIGYTGGTNIREDHMGHKAKLSPWRDANVRIEGGAVHSLQNIFLSDWRYSISDKKPTEYYLNNKYFPQTNQPNDAKGVAMQVISSGPDNTNESIKECMIKMIVSAKKKICIQTPYFVPDDSFVGALKLALLSGVEVELMMPKKIDHLYVHLASYSYINDFLDMGGKVYIYNGFLHSKVLFIDDKILTLGSCNVDIRSFSLNFEDNVVIYNKEKILEYKDIYKKDILMCKEYTQQDRKNRNVFFNMLVSIARLFSSIL